MADVDGAGRAQLMLIGGLALAVALVALALILNSVIFTENLATRNVGSDVQDASEFRGETRDSVGGSIMHVNDVYRGDDFETLYQDEYRPVLRNISARTANAKAVAGTAVDVDDVFGHPGTAIVDDNESAFQTFTPRSLSIVNWTVAKNVTFRRFRMTPKRGGIAEVSLSSVKDALKNEQSVVFFVKFTDSQNRNWYLAVWKDSSTGTMDIMSYNKNTGNFSAVCSTSANAATIEFTHQTFNGSHCNALEFTEDIDGKTTIQYWNGDLAAGTYRLFVDRAQESLRDVVNTANYDNQCSSETYYRLSDNKSPYTAAAIYSSIVNATYRSSSAEYDGEIYVEPDPIGTDAIAPTVTEFNVTDNSGSDGVFQVDWNTSEPKRDPVNVTLRLYDDSSLVSGDKVDEKTGLPASGSEQLEDTIGSLVGTYTIAVFASDDQGNQRRVTQVHDDDGDGDPDATSCVP